jgi:single-strand DNA-binding protein
MPERDRPPYLPLLPERFPRTDFIPTLTPAPAGETVNLDAVALPPPVDAGPQDSATGEPSVSTGEAVPDREARERERVHLAGRVGQTPRLRTTPKGTLVAQFPLGVKAEADIEQTTWHTIIAFQKRAEQVRDTLTKGDPVEVIGYVHERAILRRDGSSRTVQEIYATVIKPR